MKFILTTLMMCVCLSMFGNMYTEKTTVEQCEEAILKTTKVNVKILLEMRAACIKDASLQNNFEAFKTKFIELSKKYGYKFKNGQDYCLAQSIFQLKHKELYQPMIKYADGKNIYVNIYWVNKGVLKLNKEEFLNIFQTCMNDKKILRDIRYCTVLVANIKKYQNLLTPEETVKCLKELKRQIYPNISKSDKWKSLAVQIELMIKANE